MNGDLTADDFGHIRQSAALARAEVYIVQTEGGPGIDASSAAAGRSRSSAISSTNADPLQGLQNIAGASGGQVFHIALSNETALDRIARETSAYYVVTFDAEPDDRNGTNHPISLKATRGDITLRVRPDLYVPKASASATTKAPSVQDMLKTSDKFNGLAIRTQAYSSKMPAGAGDKDKIFVQVITEPVEAGVKFASASAGLYLDNKLVTHDTADSAGLAAMPLNSRMQVAPGKYRLRVAATDAAGHAGAVDMPVDIGLTTGGPFQMGTMRLGSLQNNALKTQLQFSNEPEVVAFFELYGGAAGAQLYLDFDVAKSVEGPAILQIQPDQPIGAGDHYIITGKIPLKDLPPGDYVVRAKVGVEGNTGLITRTLRKVK
jgi:hypothetical protein